MRLMLKVREVADLLGIHKFTVWSWIRQKRLKARKVGHQYFINVEDLAKFLGTTAEKVKSELEEVK